MDGLPAATSPPADSVYEAPAVLRLLCAERRSEEAGVTVRRAPAVQVAVSAGVVWLGYHRRALQKLWR